MPTACRHLNSHQSISGTSAHPTMVTLVMVMNGWLASFSFHVNRPTHSWDKAISDSDLKTPRSRSWVWSKSKFIQSAQNHINSLPFHFKPIRPTIPEIQLFRNLTLKHTRSRSWVRSKVKVTYHTQHATDALPFHFTSIRPTLSWDMAKRVFDLEKTHPKCLKKICQNNSFQQNFLLRRRRRKQTENIKSPQTGVTTWSGSTLNWKYTPYQAKQNQIMCIFYGIYSMSLCWLLMLNS